MIEKEIKKAIKTSLKTPQAKKDKISKEQAIDKWIKREIQYAKRQITWFKKKKYINWVDMDEDDWHKHVERLVKTWYANN